MKKLAAFFLMFAIVVTFVISCSHKKKNFSVVDIPKAKPKSDPDWKKIWTSSNSLSALKTYGEDYGLYLETTEKNKSSVVRSEDGCGEIYMTLVKDTEPVTEALWEIDSTGKILNKWNTGTSGFMSLDGKSSSIHNRIVKIEGAKVTREMTYFEDPKEFDFVSGKIVKRGPVHNFYMSIDTNKNFEVLSKNNGQIKSHKFQTTKCPAFTNELKKFEVYCVEDVNTKKVYVLEHECS